MAKARTAARLAAGLLAWGGAAGMAWADPTPAQMLGFKPKQEAAVYGTPAETELSACKVELIKGTGRASGWLLRDAQGKPARRFFDIDGDGKIDVWSYFLAGEETYREVDSNGNGKVDQYRWLGAAGSRWGVSTAEDGRIARWEQISLEEVSQEILAAVQTRDLARLQALMVTEAEVRELGLPDREMARIRESLAKAPEVFNKTAAELIGLGGKAVWQHVETKAPQCEPADSLGSKADLVHHKSASVLYQSGKDTGWLQTGELLLIRGSWRLAGAPTAGYAVDDGPGPEKGVMRIDESVKAEIQELEAVDKKQPQPSMTGQADPAVVQYNLARAAVLEKIVAKLTKPDQAEDRAGWVKQVADCLSAAAQNSPAADKAAYNRLVSLRDQTAREKPGSALAAYVAYREMSADYASKLSAGGKAEEMTRVQEGWRERLKEFVEKYPEAEDAPDALMQLGMVSEFVGKETEAKNWYEKLANQFPKHPMGVKAAGAVARLGSEGKDFPLSAPVLGSGQAFDLARMKGKVVVVYYWASWNNTSDGDFAKLRGLVNTYGPKGFELVTVNLDNSAGAAQSYLQKTPVPGTHLYQQAGEGAAGLDSPLANQYGILVTPHMFLVGKDGKVVSRSVQAANLEDELKKLLN